MSEGPKDESPEGVTAKSGPLLSDFWFYSQFGTGIKRNNPGGNPGLSKSCTKPYQEGTGFIRRYKF